MSKGMRHRIQVMRNDEVQDFDHGPFSEDEHSGDDDYLYDSE